MIFGTNTKIHIFDKVILQRDTLNNIIQIYFEKIGISKLTVN